MSALREIIAHFGVQVDDGPLNKLAGGIEGVIGQITQLAGAAGIGLGIGALAHFATSLTEEADALIKQSRALGLSFQQLQEWNYVAAIGGASAEALSGALAKIGAGKFDKGIASLGIKTKDASGQLRDSGDILEDVADALDSIKNPAERNRKAVQVLGKSYAAMLPALEGGGDGIRKLRKEFQELGGGFTEDFGKQSEEFNDNLTRMRVIWKTVGITIVGQILPTMLQLSQRFIGVLRPIVALIKNTNALKAAGVLLALKGLFVVSKAMGTVGNAVRVLTTRLLPLILLFLLLEDAMGFLEGRDSLIGRFLDNAFGPGTSEKVRKWVFGVITDIKSFVRELRDAPLKLADDWEVFTSTLAKDMRSTFGGFGDVINAAGALFLWLIDLVTGGWDNLVAKLKAADDGILLVYKILWTELKNGFLILVAEVEDAFTKMWNGVLSGAQGALGVLAQGAAAVGATDTVKRLQGVGASIESSKGAGDAVARAQAAATADRLAIAGEGDAIGARLNGGVKGTVTGNVTVIVPPGTPEQVANRVGAAANSGMTKSLSATKAAVAGGG